MPHPPSQPQNNERPTLPSIRDLFRDELSRRPATPQFSPSSALARLDVNDDDDRESVNRYYNPSSHSYTKPSSGHPPHPANAKYPERYPPTHLSSRRSESSSYSSMRSNTHPTPDSQYNALGMYDVPTRSISTDESSSSRHRQMDSQYYTRPYDPSDSSLAASSYHQSRHPQTRFPESSPPLLNIATSSRSRNTMQDEERTPINRFGNSLGTSTGNLISVSRYSQEDIAGAAGKYECEYCGKGFTRPSSLKIHLNSHTGEKPFACPVEGCGRSFSVLSNMRRHTRVHAAPPGVEDEGQTQPVSLSYTQRWTQRRDSSASFSSDNSRSSRSLSSDGDE